MNRLIRVALCVGVWLAAAPVVAEPPDPAASAERRHKPGRSKAGAAKARARAKATAEAKAKSSSAVEPDAGDVPENANADDKTPNGANGEESAPVAPGPSVRRSNHMEFDARLVKGETAGSGAVILFNRGARDLPRLTKLRTQFLDATIEPVLERDGSKD